MEVNLLNLRKLFVQPARYEIPRFQRRYVWEEDSQWSPLWDDVQHAAERILEARRGVPPEAQPHFMGAVVLQQVANESGSLVQREVVDGQQRLTTLQLLLDATQEILERRKIDGPAARLENLVLNQPQYRAGNADNKFKVWPTDADQEAFRHAMDNDLSGEEYSESSIVQAHEFFRRRVDQWIGEDEGLHGNAHERAEALEKALSQRLELVVIDLHASDNSHIIFETLNARGTPLRQSDLIKNMILHEAEKTGVGDKVTWPFKDDWWDQDIRQGRLIRSRIDVFLNYWLAMRMLQEVAAAKVFASFQQYHKEREHVAISDIADDIASVGSAYRRLEAGELEGAWATFIPRWKVMQAAVATPVLLWLLSSRVEPGQVSRAIKALESYLVRRMVCRMTTRDYNRMFVALLQHLEQADPATAGDTVIEFLRAQDAYSRIWPNDNRLLDALSNDPLYRQLTRGRLRMVMEGIEETLRTTKSEASGCPSGLTIEHIMPRRWRGVWPDPEPGNEPDEMENPEDKRDRLLHSLGNLTLVNQPLNSALSNGPWENKRQALLEHSTLFLNKDLLEHSQYYEWDEGAIRARARRLHVAFVKAWPRDGDMSAG